MKAKRLGIFSLGAIVVMCGCFFCMAAGSNQLDQTAQQAATAAIPSPSFETMRAMAKNPETTDIKWDDYIKPIESHQVATNWTGWVTDVTETYEGSGTYRVAIDMDDPAANPLSVSDIRFTTKNESARDFSGGQKVRFSGLITRISRGVLEVRLSVDIGNGPIEAVQ